MLFIDNPTVEKVLTMEDCIHAIDEAFRGLLTRESVHRTRIDIYVPCDRDDGYFRWGTMEGASKTLGVHAIRMKSDIVHWPRDEQGNWTEEKYCMEPGTYCGLIFLVSTRNGEPLALINDGVLQHIRVGATAGMGAKYLSRPDSKVVAMLGSGGMARTYLRAFCAVRPIEKVRVYSPTKAHREEYADEMSEALGLDIQVVDNPQDAVRGADIVSAATDAMTPVVLGEWLETGMHVTNLGNYELDDTVFSRGDMVIKGGLSGLIPNDPAQRIEVGRGHSPVAYIAGTDEEVNRLPPARANAQHFNQGAFPSFIDLASGKEPGRTSDDQITVYLNGGNQGLQFAAASYITYQRAKEQGLGRVLPTEWFLQDIRD